MTDDDIDEISNDSEITDEITDEITGDAAADAQVFHAAPEEVGKRLDVVLAARLPHLSRSQIQRIIGDNHAQINNCAAKVSQKIAGGDVLTLSVPAPRPSHIEAESIPLDIVYEDADLLVVNKPKAMVVHPAPGVRSGTLVNALLFHAQNGGGLSSVGGVLRPGIVHRLDKDTTGLLVVAKTDAAHQNLQAQIQARTAERKYQTLVWGTPPWKEAVVDAPLQRHATDRTRMAVGDGDGGRTHSREAVTDLHVMETFLSSFSLLQCKLHTGRTHQIRVHCAFAGFPVVGDATYNAGAKGFAGGLKGVGSDRILSEINQLNGQVLHAFSLSFNQPTSGKRLAFTAPPPPEMQHLLQCLRETNVLNGASG